MDKRDTNVARITTERHSRAERMTRHSYSEEQPAASSQQQIKKRNENKIKEITQRRQPKRKRKKKTEENSFVRICVNVIRMSYSLAPVRNGAHERTHTQSHTIPIIVEQQQRQPSPPPASRSGGSGSSGKRKKQIEFEIVKTNHTQQIRAPRTVTQVPESTNGVCLALSLNERDNHMECRRQTGTTAATPKNHTHTNAHKRARGAHTQFGGGNKNSNIGTQRLCS